MPAALALKPQAKAPPQQKRDPKDYPLSASFVQEVTDILDLQSLPFAHRFGVAYIVSCWKSFKDRHHDDPDAIAIHRDVLRLFFGKNGAIPDVIEVGSTYSKKEKRARAIKPKKAYWQELREMNTTRSTGQLVCLDGARARRKQKPVLTKRGHEADLCVEHYVPINTQACEQGIEALRQWIDYIDRKAEKPEVYSKEVKALADYLKLTRPSGRLSDIMRLMIHRRIESFREVLDCTHNGVMWHQYRTPDATGTRYYGEGLHLQNQPRIVRQTALAGCHSYDMHACHHAIFEHYAITHGLPSDFLSRYIEHKKDWRNSIADFVGCPVDLVKQALTASINGWRGKDDEEELAFLLRAEGVAKLYLHPDFAGLYNELQTIQKHLLKNATYHPKNKAIQNIKGRWLQREGSTTASRIAFLLQGIDMVALEAALKAHGEGTPLLAMHDGWVTKEVQNEQKAIDAMRGATGVTFKIDHEIYAPTGIIA